MHFMPPVAPHEDNETRGAPVLTGYLPVDQKNKQGREGKIGKGRREKKEGGVEMQREAICMDGYGGCGKLQCSNKRCPKTRMLSCYCTSNMSIRERRERGGRVG